MLRRRALTVASSVLRAGVLAFAACPTCVWASVGTEGPPGASLLIAGLLGGVALALLALAAGSGWDRCLLLVAAALICWSGLMAPHKPGAYAPLGLQFALSLCLSTLLLRQLGHPSRRWFGVGAGVAAGLVLVGWVGPLAVLPWIQRGLEPVLGSVLLAMGAYFLFQRWRSWARDGLSSWFDVAQQVQITVLPLLVTTSVGGVFLDAAGGRFPWSVSVLMLGLAGGLAYDFSRRRRQVETHLEQVEQTMQVRLAEVERHHQYLADQRLEQVTERERKRIAGDLHDDLGAKLLTIVHTSDNERISTLAREALEEMRLSVRGLTGRPVQLLDAIGDWRAEVVSRLAQSNIEAEWNSLTEEVAHTLPARAYVQTTRILREAVSNVIKHSGATRCVIRCLLAEGDFQLVIQDNGRGVPTEKDGRLDKGHGMASMKSRAKQMQGQCLVESGPGWGTLIRLTIPL